MAICALIVLGSALFIAAQVLRGADQRLDPKAPANTKEIARLQRAIVWCSQLAYLFGVVAFLLILSCQCCTGVAFAGHKSASSYE
jgi:hypothetical protein